MPRKKTNVSRQAKNKKGFKFKWWMAVGAIAIIAVVGIIVVRSGQAFGGDIAIVWRNYLKEGSRIDHNIGLTGSSCVTLNHDNQRWCHMGVRNQNVPMWVRVHPRDGMCATIIPAWPSKRNAAEWVKQYGSERNFATGESVIITEFKTGYGKKCIRDEASALGNRLPFRN